MLFKKGDAHPLTNDTPPPPILNKFHRKENVGNAGKLTGKHDTALPPLRRRRLNSNTHHAALSSVFSIKAIATYA